MRKERDLENRDEQVDLDTSAPAETKDSLLAQSAGGLISLESMLPELCHSRNAIAVVTERRELYNHLTCGYVEAAARVRRLQASDSRETYAAATNLIRGYAQDKGLIVKDEDPLETVRRSLGLDKIRDDLLFEIQYFVSVDRGISILEKILSTQIGEQVRGIEQIRKLLPAMTIAEIALLPLLEKFPEIYLENGSSFQEVVLMGKCCPVLKRLPQIHYASTSGLSFILDDYENDNEDDGITTKDVFHSLGLTGIRKNEFFVSFLPYIKTLLRRLIPLTLSNDRLFQRVRQEGAESVQIAFGRISHLCLETVLGHSVDVNTVPIELSLKVLTESQKKLYDAECSRVEKVIASAVVYDMSRKEVLDAKNVFHLLGLLATIPSVFRGPVPFIGYAQPWAASVRFLDASGALVEQVPLHPTYARNAVQSLQSEAEDEARDNRTMHALFMQIRREVADQVLALLTENPSAGSLSEAIATELWMARGIALEVSGSYEIKDLDDSRRPFWDGHVTTKHQKVILSKKIGPEESSFIASILCQLPSGMLKMVHSIRKIFHKESIFERMSGVVTVGLYESAAKRVFLLESNHSLFIDANEAQKIGLQFTVLHECGEAIWTTLSLEQQQNWTNISWKDELKERQPSEQDFLTKYSSENAKEDFCEHFAAYVVHGCEFRQRAKSAKPLAAKYAFLAELFREYAGGDADYQGTNLKIRAIHGSLLEREKELSMQDAIRLQQDESELEALDARNSWVEREDVFEYEEKKERHARLEEGEEAHEFQHRRDNWEAIYTFEKKVPGWKRLIPTCEEAAEEVRFMDFRAEVVSLVRQIPDSSGRILRVASAVIPEILDGNAEGIEEVISFVKPAKKRKRFVYRLLELRQMLK